MRDYSNPYTKKIYAALVPLVGEIVAQGVLKSQASKLGKTEENLAFDDSPRIVEGLKKGLVLFLGSESAGKIAMQIGQIR